MGYTSFQPTSCKATAACETDNHKLHKDEKEQEARQPESVKNSPRVLGAK